MDNKSKEANKELKIIAVFLIVIAILVFSLSLNSIYQMQKVHKISQDIYEHPLKVSNAALKLKMEVLNIHRQMHSPILNASKQENDNLIQKIQLSDNKIKKYIEVIKKNILGLEGREMLETTKLLYEQGQALHTRFVSLIKLNHLEEALKVESMQNHKNILVLEAFTNKLYEYANKKATKFHDESILIYERFEYISKLLTMVFFIVFSALSLYTYLQIKNYIKALRNSENRLRETTQKYEIAIRGTKDALWDWDIKNGTIYFSPVWKEMLGYTDKELPNEFSTWEERVHPDDLQNALDAINKAHAKKGVEYKIIHRLKHKDGHWVWILDRGETIFDTKGKVVRMVGFHTDISVQKEQEVAITKLSLLLSSTINSIDALVFVKDKEFKYLEFNKAFEVFLGHSREELLGHDDYDFFKKEQADFFRSHDSEVLNTLKAKSDLHKIKTATGDEIYQLATISPLIDKMGNVTGIVGTAVDITEIKKLEAELESQEELMIAQSRHAAMGEMISMIAHQWRQPLSVISMDANNILVDIELDAIKVESLKEDATNIVDQTQHLSKTIDDFRNFFKPNKLKDEVLIPDIFNEALQVIGKSFENNNILLETSFESTTKIKIYSRELLQVLLNILKNAKEALLESREEDRKVNAKVYEDEENVVIEISDNAGGIKEDILEKIFDPYFSTKDAKNGTGLGLYMSKVIVDKHLNGIITANNTQTGVVFVIKLSKLGGE